MHGAPSASGSPGSSRPHRRSFTPSASPSARGLTLVVAVLQAAIGPMVSAAILAEEHKLDATVANATLAIGVVLSLITVPAIDALL